MPTPGPMASERARAPIRLLPSISAIRCLSPFGKIAEDPTGRFLVAGLLTLTAACMSVGLVAFIALEAFDSDLNLWPLGAEDFSVEVHGQFMTGGQAAGSPIGLGIIPWFVVPAGSYLVLRHRARSALASDSAWASNRFDVAERLGRHPDAPQTLGHLFISCQAMAGTAHLPHTVGGRASAHSGVGIAVLPDMQSSVESPR